jgi:hypothetical protein
MTNAVHLIAVPEDVRAFPRAIAKGEQAIQANAGILQRRKPGQKTPDSMK